MQTNEPAPNPNPQASGQQPAQPFVPQQQPSSSVSSPGQRLNQEKKSNKGLVLGLISLVLISLGIAGVFAYQNYQLKKQVEKKPSPSPEVVATEEPQPTPANIVVSSPSPSAKVDPTANWKKVQINDLNVDPQTKVGSKIKGLEIKYPPDWFYLSAKSLGGTGAGDFIMNFPSNKILEDVSKDDIQIKMLLLLPPQEGLNEFVNSYQKTGLTSAAKIKINEFEGYKGETDKEVKYFIKIDENNILHIYITPKDSELINISEQIVSTLNLIN